jgi:hypothetical protein
MALNDETGNQGLGSPKMDEKTAHSIHSKGGKATPKSKRGAAGKTEAARRGGENSH